MNSELETIPESSIEAKSAERLKFLFLAIIFFFVIGAYTVIRDLKNSVFVGLIGKEYLPIARLIFPFMLIPAVLLYSKLVDKVRRYYLLGIYSLFYAIVCLVFAFFIGHPSIGIGNTNQSAYRLFGWLFYFFVEGFSPFVLSVFWAFSNSISSPDGAKRNYGIVVSASKIGGMLTAGLAWALFTLNSFPILGCVSDVFKLRLMLVIASSFLFAIPVFLRLLMKFVPGRYLHGYEAAYKVEKKRAKAGKSATGILAGLKMLIKYPYVLGIFSTLFFYEILNTITSYLRVVIAQKSGQSIAGTSGVLFKWVFIMHLIGLCISFFGTTSLLRRFGTRYCVVLVPVLMGVIILGFILFPSYELVVMSAYTITKAIHYAFSKPVTESLYIPTLKEIKFKSKSWIDAFGSKFAKWSGSVFNLFAVNLPHMAMSLYSFSFAIIIGLWFVAALFLGRRFDKAIKSDEVIGEV